MAQGRASEEDFAAPIRRLLVGGIVLVLILTFGLWRIDSPRAERFRAALVDTIVPPMDWALVPVARGVDLARGFQSYARLAEQNAELRRELRQMQAWKEAAQQLGQEIARGFESLR